MMAMNIGLNNKVIEVDRNWCFPGYNYFEEDNTIIGNRVNGLIKKDYRYENIKLIHWNGPCKPWNFTGQQLNKDIFYIDKYEYYRDLKLNRVA